MAALRYLLPLFIILYSLFLAAPAHAQVYLRACYQYELNYLEPTGLVSDSSKCSADSMCVTPVSGDIMVCNRPKSGAESNLCPGNPALYSTTTPPHTQSCPILKKACLLPGDSPTYVCIPDDVKGGCDPTTDSKCPSAKGVECSGGVVTALGCVKTEPAQIISSTVGISVGAGGAISLLVMIYGAFQMLTSGGSSDRLKEGRERFLAAAIGLTFITLAIFLLQIVGVDILNLPGFSK